MGDRFMCSRNSSSVLSKLAMYTTSLYSAWQIGYSLLVFIRPVPPYGFTKILDSYVTTKALEEHHGTFGQLSHLYGSLCLDEPFLGDH